MSFHCEGTITKIKYKIDSLQCRCHGNKCSEGSGKYGTLPQLQLWRKNGTIYYLEEDINLTDGSSEQTIQWKFQDEDAIGIWIPSSINECSCVSEKINKIGFFYGKSSRNYHLDGYHETFNTSYYKLEDGPMPMITVETDKEYNVICIIGIPAGSLVAIAAICFTCVGICWSISRERRKRIKIKTGELVISQPNFPDELRETEEIQMNQGRHINRRHREYDDSSFDDNEPTYEELPEHPFSIPLQPIPGLESGDIREEYDLHSDGIMSDDPRMSYAGNISFEATDYNITDPGSDQEQYVNISPHNVDSLDSKKESYYYN